MEFRILGPLEVVENGQALELGPPKQRELLALLVINANRVVTTDRILDELWGDDATGKERSLWVYVSRLRSVLDPDRSGRSDSSVLATRDHGYVLNVESDSIDAARFEQAAQEARALVREDPNRASALLASALRSWRGGALEEFTFRDFARAEIVRLEHLRLAAIEDRIDADLRCGKSGELVGELEALRAQHPVRERFVAQLMLALYQAGRQADALRAFDRFRRDLGEETGLEPSPELRRLEEQILLHDPGLHTRLPARGRRSPRADARRNPFKGLRAFAERDSGDFFGRDRVVSDVIRRIAGGASLVALVGPSGSGKSSVLRAGVIPALLKDQAADPEPTDWRVALMVPGAHPFAELEAALLRSALDAPESLGDQLSDPVNGLLRAALRLIPDDRTRLLIAIDQFEELFTLADGDECARFIANLLPVIDDPHQRVSVVLTLRADFYDRPLAFPEFAGRLGDAVVNIASLTPDELEEAAQRPAESVGALLSPGLLTTLVADVVGRQGSLPLFQFALTELYDRRTGQSLTLETYRAMDGVNGVLRRRADDLFDELEPHQQAVARQLFPRLATISDSGELGRRRLAASEIMTLGLDLVAVQEVVERFARNRLLTLDRDAVSGSPTVAVAHEALLTEWPRLTDWIEESHDDLRRLAMLEAEVSEWLESGRDPALLPARGRLERHQLWAETSSLSLTALQREYLDEATRAEEERERLETDRSEQMARRMERSARTARRRLWTMAATAVVVVAVAAAFLLAPGRPEPFSVAVIAPSLPPYEGSLVATGIARAERELPVTIDFRQRVADLEREYRDLAEQGTDLIFLDPGNSGWNYVVEVIEDHPDTTFAVVDGVVPPAGARSTYVADEEGGYLAGLAAALTTETGVVGFVGAKHAETTDYWRAGFEAGVFALDPEIEVMSIHIATDSSAFGDVAGAGDAAHALFERNADVVLAVAEDANLGVIEAAFEHSRSSGLQRWVIGSGSDWSNEVADHLRPHLLTSALKRWDVAMFETIREFADDGLEPGIRLLDLADGAVALADSVHLSAETQERITEVSSPVTRGASSVPRVPTRELLPPPGLVVSREIVVRWDGRACRFDGDPTGLEAGDGLLVELVNETTEFRQFWATQQSGRGFDVPVSTLVGPLGTTSAYIALERGSLEINCGPDLRGGEPVDAVNATVLSIG